MAFSERMSRFKQQLFKHARVPFFGMLQGGARTLLFRIVLVLILLFTAVLIIWLGRAGLKDGHDGHISFSDVIYFTAVTLTTVGYGDIAPISNSARLVDAILVTPIRIAIWLIFIGTAYEFLAHHAIENWRSTRIRKMLKNHTILCGYGRTGEVTLQELIEKGFAKDKIAVVDSREEALLAASDAGFAAFRGDPVQAKSLLQVEIARADCIIFSLARDDATALAVLTARKLAPQVRIVALVRDQDNVTLLRHAGADVVIHQGRVSGFLLADAVHSKFSVGFLTDLMTCRGRLNLIERPAAPEEIGQKLGQIAHRFFVGLERNGQRHLYSAQPIEVIQAGDLLLMIEDQKYVKKANTNDASR